MRAPPILTNFTFVYFIFTVSFASASTPEIRVGAILPLTGVLAPVGVSMQRGIELAREDITDLRFQVFFEDDQTNTKTVAVTAAAKLLDVDQVMVILNSETGTMNSIAPILQRRRVPGLVLWDSNSTLPELGDCIFGFGYNTELAGREMAVFTAAVLHSESVAVVAANDEWSELLATSFEREFVRKTGRVVREQINGDETDFRTQILKFKRQQIGAVYLPLWGASLRSFIRQSRELMYSGNLLAADAFSTAEIEDLGSLSDGIYVTQAWLDAPEFANRYRRRFSGDMNNINLAYVAVGYDSLLAIAEGLRLAEKKKEELSSKSLRDALPGLTFKGILGATSISAQRRTDRREQILEVREGRFQLPPAR